MSEIDSGRCKPCRICGSDDLSYFQNGDETLVYVQCGKCGASGPHANADDLFEVAELLWNLVQEK